MEYIIERDGVRYSEAKVGKITIEQIPEMYREAVKKELKIN